MQISLDDLIQIKILEFPDDILIIIFFISDNYFIGMHIK